MKPLINLLAILSTACPTTTNAATYFTETEFSNFNTAWVTTQLQTSNIGGEAAFGVLPSGGGNPEPSFIHAVDIRSMGAGAGHWMFGVFRNDATYNPDIEGAITTISLSIDLKELLPANLLLMTAALAIRQNDSVYTSSFIAPSGQEWVTQTQFFLAASSFTRVAGTGPLNLDFSNSGAEMNFGFATQVSFSAIDVEYQGRLGIDNWEVAIVPESSTATIALAMLLVAGFYRNR